ncbi:MAG: 50S ribosomal protein L3 [Dehalococcoidia bacterium]|nr:50S ribosomal protein L3 [Dehalococcoidia bacterium]
MNGLLGKKLGMSQYFAADGRMYAVTVVEAGPCIVTQVKTEEKDGYRAVQVGFAIAKKLSNAEKGHLGFGGLKRTRKRENAQGGSKSSPLGLLKHLKEFALAEEETPAVGEVLTVQVFSEGQKVDIEGLSKGKGFAGGIKLHHFHGGPKSHGQSDRHRAPGSIGSGTTPGRVLKGLRMAAHMGHDKVTAKNLEVLHVEPERNLLFIKGSVPGPANGLVVVKQSRG